MVFSQFIQSTYCVLLTALNPQVVWSEITGPPEATRTPAGRAETDQQRTSAPAIRCQG